MTASCVSAAYVVSEDVPRALDGGRRDDAQVFGAVPDALEEKGSGQRLESGLNHELAFGGEHGPVVLVLQGLDPFELCGQAVDLFFLDLIIIQQI